MFQTTLFQIQFRFINRSPILIFVFIQQYLVVAQLSEQLLLHQRTRVRIYKGQLLTVEKTRVKKIDREWSIFKYFIVPYQLTIENHFSIQNSSAVFVCSIFNAFVQNDLAFWWSGKRSRSVPNLMLFLFLGQTWNQISLQQTSSAQSLKLSQLSSTPATLSAIL